MSARRSGNIRAVGGLLTEASESVLRNGVRSEVLEAENGTGFQFDRRYGANSRSHFKREFYERAENIIAP
jgi:hypothetical protein